MSNHTLDIPIVIEVFLYSSHDSHRIASIQERLQGYQKSSQGYQLGIELLNNPDKNVKYFGALTLTVYLNTHVIPNDQINIAFNEILRQTFLLCDPKEINANLFVIRKLLSNLSLIYINYFQTFVNDPICSLLSAMLQRPEISASQIPIIINELQDETQFELLLTFLATLAEEISRQTEYLPDLHSLIHQTIFQHLKVLYEKFSQTSGILPEKLQLLSLDCLNSWVVYISVAENHSDQRYGDDMEIFMTYLLNQFNLGNQTTIFEDKMEIYNKSFTVLTEILDNIPRIVTKFKPTILSILFEETKFGASFINTILLNTEFAEMYSSEIQNFVNLLITYLSLNLVHLSRTVLTEPSGNIIRIIMTLTNFPGNPTEDEKISEQLLAFWEEFANTFIDDAEAIGDIIFNEQTLAQYNSTRDAIFHEVSQIYFKKMRLFPNATKEFSHYRSQVAELFILFYSMLGLSLYSSLCDLIRNNLIQIRNNGHSEEVVNDLETGLYLVYKITDDLTFYDDEFAIGSLVPLINGIFNEDLIGRIEAMPDYANKHISVTLLNLLSCLHFFFKSDIGCHYLPTTFNFLFSVILGNAKPTLSLIASKTVLKVCQDSEDKLVAFLPNLEMILIEMLKNPLMDGLIRERMTNSYISISQSIKDPVDLGNRIYKILIVISEQYNTLSDQPESFVNSTASPEPTKEIIEDYAISLLSCINEIGKATELPEDIEDCLTPEQLTQTNLYWTEDPLNIKSMILESLNQFSLNIESLAKNTLMTEKCCNILKSGLSEPINGPFKFELEVIFSYLIVKIKNCNIQSIPPIYKLVETIVITNRKQLTPETLGCLLQGLFGDIYTILETDIDLIKASIELFSTIIERSPNLILKSSLFQDKILTYALFSLKNHETFTIKAVVKFWVNLITLKRGNADDHYLVRELITKKVLMTSEFPMGYDLSAMLMAQFIDAPRSALEHYYPLFRNLIGKYPMEYKAWLLYFLSNNQVGKVASTQNEINQFVNKLMITRGQRQANEVLKNYWLQVNKLTEYRK
ncbi:PDR6 [[Candida] subhashii]|uniref:PDR6 n=1 Tax=[Candida] subhashii TaxID=561895 RepID=A0A8J5QN53_9ASCO|nr:PDR6 [[Candida] subhashii]KAG7663420.1 PDR6 [[Candida] subhashii]